MFPRNRWRNAHRGRVRWNRNQIGDLRRDLGAGGISRKDKPRRIDVKSSSVFSEIPECGIYLPIGTG